MNFKNYSVLESGNWDPNMNQMLTINSKLNPWIII